MPTPCRCLTIVILKKCQHCFTLSRKVGAEAKRHELHDVTGGVVKLIFLMLAVLTSYSVAANENYCYSIKDHDQKNSCLAQAKEQVSYCYSIQESDAKSYCVAQVGGKRNYCYRIENKDMKNRCLSMVN